jgi:hypothetical protein
MSMHVVGARYCLIIVHISLVLKIIVYITSILNHLVGVQGYVHAHAIKKLSSQTTCINLYKNFRVKIMKCCANIYFNRQSLVKKKIIPNYVEIKIPYNSPAPNITQKKVQAIRLKKKEIKFL